MSTPLTLHILDDDGSLAMALAVPPPACTLGRDPENDLVLDRDSVSGTHAKFSRDPDGDWWVEDLGSTNGIWRGEEELKGLHRLVDGEVIEIGVVKVRIVFEAEPGSQPMDASANESRRIQVEEEEDDTAPPAPADSSPILIDLDDGVEDEDLMEEVSPPRVTAPEDGPSGSNHETADPEPEEKAESDVEAPPEDTGTLEETSGADVPRRAPSTWTDRALEFTFVWLERLHLFLARWLPRIIGGGVARFCRLPMPARFTAGFGVAAALFALFGWGYLPGYFTRMGFNEDHMEVFTRHGFPGWLERLTYLVRGVSVLCLGAAAWAWVRKGRTLKVFKAVLAFTLLVWMYVFHFFTRAPSFLNGVDYKLMDSWFRNEIWLKTWSIWMLALIPVLPLVLGVALRAVRNFYRGETAVDPLTGDDVVENLRTGGRDPRMRSSSYWALFLFVAVLGAPFLMTTCGREKPYGLVKGSGEPVVEMMKVERRKKKPKKKMIVNNWSPYIFERMEIDDIKVLEDLEQASMDTYEIAQEKTGKLGQGGGDKGGWPEGMEGATVRFIRLEYDGGDWDQDMGRGADYNLLIRFNQITGFPIAKDTESKRVARLTRFPKGKKPPFVYMTGMGGVRFSNSEIKTLRWYTLEEGGMLFIDHGGGSFGRNVESVLRRMFPGQRLVDIPNDDPIFKAPFVFPGGAPPLWQHGGTRAKGIRHNGRWVVFYHPGDMGDAWKTGHSGVAPEIAEQAYRLGINVMYYAFNMYYARHYE